MSDMYGRAALREGAALALPRQRDHAAYHPEAVAWLGDELFCAFTLHASKPRQVLLGFREGKVTRRIDLPTPVIDLAVHRGRLVLLALGLDVLWLDGDAIRPLGESSTAPPVPEGPHPASAIRSEAAWCFDTSGQELVVYYLCCGEQRAFARYAERSGWTPLPAPEPSWSVSLCMRDGAPLLSCGQTVGRKTSYPLLTFSEGSWKTLKPRAHFVLMKTAAKLHTSVRVRNDELGRVLGLMQPDAIVRLGDKEVFEWPAEKWQLPTSTAELVRSTGWSFFSVEDRAGEPMLVETRAEQVFAQPETQPRSAKPPKLVFPPSRFFDGTLVARDCFLSVVHFVDDDCLIALGSTKKEVVLHELRRRDGTWTHVKRHALPLAYPRPPDPYGHSGDYQYTLAQGAPFLTIGLCTHSRYQLVRFDLARGSFEDLARGEGYLCGAVHETFVVSAPIHAHGPVVFVRPGAAEVRTEQSFAGGSLRPIGRHVYATAGGVAHAIDPQTGKSVRAWTLPHPEMAIYEVATAVLARGTTGEAFAHEVELRWDQADAVPQPRSDLPNQWKFLELDVRTTVGKATQLVDGAGVVRFELDIKSNSRGVDRLAASPSGRFWTAGDMYDFAILEHAGGKLRLAPRAKDASPEERCDQLYPGFLASQTRVWTIKKWPLAVAIYEALVESSLASEFSLSSFAAVFPKRIDIERMGLVRDAVRCVHFLAETSPRLGELTRLTHEVNGNAIHQELFVDWDGEDETFNVGDLRGIEMCSGLEEVSLHLDGGGAAVDVRPLTKLPRLRKLVLRGAVDHVDALSDVKSLRELGLEVLPPRATRELFEKAGIRVEQLA